MEFVMHDYRKNFEVMLLNDRYQIVRKKKKNSSGWNSSDVGDALVLLAAVVGAIVMIALYY
jgi:hypothetical protein